MKVYLLRHTSLNVRENTFYGQTDLDVSENFLDELSEIKRKITKYKIKEGEIEIFSSPLKRCSLLARNLFRSFSTDSRLKELYFGDWEMKKFEDIPIEQIKSWENDIINFEIPNGESNKVFFERLKSFCDETTKLRKDIFVVAHAGSINCIISYLAGIPFEKLVRENWKKIGYGSLSILKKESRDYTIELFGDNVFGKEI